MEAEVADVEVVYFDLNQVTPDAPNDSRLHVPLPRVSISGGNRPLRSPTNGYSAALGKAFASPMPANRRNASAICSRPRTAVAITSTMVKEEWKWPRAWSCSTGTPAAVIASA